jgi:hypothetical protein
MSKCFRLAPESGPNSGHRGRLTSATNGLTHRSKRHALAAIDLLDQLVGKQIVRRPSDQGAPVEIIKQHDGGLRCAPVARPCLRPGLIELLKKNTFCFHQQ